MSKEAEIVDVAKHMVSLRQKRVQLLTSLGTLKTVSERKEPEAELRELDLDIQRTLDKLIYRTETLMGLEAGETEFYSTEVLF